jgi:hypothetical protein
MAANQYDAGPDEQSQLSDFTSQETFGAFVEIAPMANAPLCHLLDPSLEGLPQTPNSDALGYWAFAGADVAGQYIQQTDQT